ncbi:MAG: tandem-95 repeat protein [Calditrichaceae bacterium]|nr:tandem-95 repeat protein [Calditrichaceae bacterium]
MNGKALLYILVIAFLLFPVTSANAQKASAEFISSVSPQTLISGEPVKDGIQNLFLQGNKLYVANTWAGLQVLDVSDPKNPKEIGKYELTKRTRNVYVDGNYAFLSVEIEGVYILNIADPKNIRLVSKIIPPTQQAFWVIAQFPNVYIAEGPQGISIYNIRQPDRPRLSGSLDTNGWAWGLFLYGTDLYVADKTAGVVIIDVSNPGSPVKRGQFLGMKNAKTIQVEENLAYVANGPDGLWILDVSSPEVPSLVTKVPVDGYVYHASKTRNTLFMANELGKKLEIVDVTNPRNPVKAGEYLAKSKIYYAIKEDVYVYTAADDQTLIVRQNFEPVIARVNDQIVEENSELLIVPDAYDPDGDEIYFTIKNLPEGAVFDSSSGELTWIPNYEQSGRYPKVNITVIEKTDSKLSTSTEFEITVTHVNRNPELPDVEDYVIDEDKLLTFTIPEGSDPDIEDKGRLTYDAQGLPDGAQFNPQTRVFAWTPTYEQSGVYTVDFAIMDPAGGVYRDASVLTVNHIDRKPVLEPVANQIVNENELLTVTLSGSDPDMEDQNALSYHAQNLPKGAGFDPQTATLSWTPTYDQSGAYASLLFIFKAGALSDSITFNVTVNHVNRPPVLDAIVDAQVDENKLLKFNISGSDPDIEDEGKLVYTASNLPEGAVFKADSLLFKWAPTYEQSGTYENISFTVVDPSGLTASQSITITAAHVNRPPVLAEIPPQTVDENANLAFTLVGSDLDVEDEGKLVYTAKGLPEGAALNGTNVTWTPTYDQSGSYPVSFTVSDGRLSDTKSTTITVNHVNRPPVMDVVTAQSVDENALLTFDLSGSDPDAEDKGKWSIQAQGLPDGAVFDSTADKFSWTPTFEQSGSYQVVFMNKDPGGLTDQKTAEITVNHVNRTPILPEQAAQAVDENTALAYNLIPATDPDEEDEGKITYQAADLPEGAVFDATALTFNWMPTYDQSGSYTISFSATDGAFTVSQPMTITVNHVNRPPVITAITDQVVDENQPWSLKVEYSDPDKEDEGKLVITAENLPDGAKFDAASAQFNWTPTFDQSGDYTGITVNLNDSEGLSDSKTFNLKVNHVNRTPELAAVPAAGGAENAVISFTLSGTDPDKEDEGKLVYACSNLPAGATLNAQSGEFAWTPNFTQAGEFTLNFKVNDPAGLSAEHSAVITVTDVNRAPVLNAVADAQVNENEELKINLVGSDEDTDNTLTYSADNLPSGTSLNSSSGEFTWKPTFTQAGDYSVTFKLSDGKETVSQTAEIKVNNVNRAPKISGSTSETVEVGSAVQVSFSGSDPDGDDLTFECGNLPSGADFDGNSGQFSWTPSDDQVGEYALVVKVSDGTDEASTRCTITVKAKPVPEPVEAPADTSGTQ